MSDLNEVVQTVTRKKWDRCHRFYGENNFQELPKLTFDIQTATSEDGIFKGAVPKGFIDAPFDPTEVYPLIDPRDDSVIDPTGGNHFMVQVHLYSLFKYKMENI